MWSGSLGAWWPQMPSDQAWCPWEGADAGSELGGRAQGWGPQPGSGVKPPGATGCPWRPSVTQPAPRQRARLRQWRPEQDGGTVSASLLSGRPGVLTQSLGQAAL